MDTMRQNITDALVRAMRSHIVGMSMGNLKQITTTRGVHVTPAEYHREFPRIARDIAAQLRFNLY